MCGDCVCSDSMLAILLCCDVPDILLTSPSKKNLAICDCMNHYLFAIAGWTPSTFVSSRQQKAGRQNARPEDFMDEEVGLHNISSLSYHTEIRTNVFCLLR
uniref:G patch domain-containing protein n=1 Tax=Hucho hucho TaxID=62062 RepID=A0A4W5LKP2_9TELE